MDAVAVDDPCGPLRVIGDVLGRADGHRRAGIKAGKQPRGGPGELPIGAQFGQKAGGEQCRAILAPFALLDPDEPARTCNVRELEADDCTDAQARGLGRHQEDTVSGVLGAREQALEFLNAQDLGELRQRRARRQVQIPRLPPEGFGREKAEPTGHLVTGTPGAVAVDQHIVQGAAHLVGAQLVRRAMGERRQACHSGDRGGLGLGGEPFEWHLVDHLGTSRGHSGSLPWKGETDGGTHPGHLHGATVYTGYEGPSTLSATKSEALTPSGRGMTERRPRKGGGGMGKTAAQRLSATRHPPPYALI
jgi:hypothetical protein